MLAYIPDLKDWVLRERRINSQFSGDLNAWKPRSLYYGAEEINPFFRSKVQKLPYWVNRKARDTYIKAADLSNLLDTSHGSSQSVAKKIKI